jgi:Fe2+ transport system protein FeoA
MHRVSLVRVKKGIKVKIVEITAGKLASSRLSFLGLRIGSYVIKISAFALKGPITVKIGSTTLALGHGMAEKILVDARPEIFKERS